MATVAPTAPAESKRPGLRAIELFLVYPTFGLALLTALPTWWDKYQAWQLNLDRASAAKAIKQSKLLLKNLSCVEAPFSYYNSPRKVEIDATICNSGDILVSTVVPNKDPYMSVIALDDLIDKNTNSGFFAPAAQAATLGYLYDKPKVKIAPVQLAQVTATVICQKVVENRYIHRRIQTPQGCRDQVIDTYNGRITSDTAAPSCAAQC